MELDEVPTLPNGEYPFIDQMYPLDMMTFIDAPQDLETLFKTQAERNGTSIIRDQPVVLRCVSDAWPEAKFSYLLAVRSRTHPPAHSEGTSPGPSLTKPQDFESDLCWADKPGSGFPNESRASWTTPWRGQEIPRGLAPVQSSSWSHIPKPPKPAISRRLELSNDVGVARDVRGELRLPEIRVGARCRGATTSFVSMPETPVNEDNRTPARKNDIGPTRQSPAADPEPVTQSMRHLANGDLRRRVRLPHHAHVQRSLHLGQLIHHEDAPSAPRQLR